MIIKKRVTTAGFAWDRDPGQTVSLKSARRSKPKTQPQFSMLLLPEIQAMPRSGEADNYSGLD